MASDSPQVLTKDSWLEIYGQHLSHCGQCASVAIGEGSRCKQGEVMVENIRRSPQDSPEVEDE